MDKALHTAFLLLAAAALTAAGCSKDVRGDDASFMEITVSLPADAVTRAACDADGDGRSADRCRLQIYSGDKLYYDRTVDVKDFMARFNDIQLDRSLRYDYLFWADNRAGDFYDTSDLRNVSMKAAYRGGDDRRDAFSGAALGRDVDDMCDSVLVLVRPFAQLNVITADVPSIYDQLPDKAALPSILPDSLYIRINEVATSFNVATGAVGGYRTLEYSAPVYTKSWRTAASQLNTLSMDYFFADSADVRIAEVDFSYRNSACGIKPVDFHWSNVPVKRNFRTNVSGNLISLPGTLNVNVTLSPDWDDEYILQTK